MSEWVGMHNPERHQAYTVGGAVLCRHCERVHQSLWCHEGCPCRCCLEAEVERLTAAIQRVRELAHNALLGTDAGMGYPHVSAEDILRALDGDDQADHECRCEVCVGEDGDA